MERSFILFGLIFLFFGIVLGAFAAHYLETIQVSEAKIKSFKVGVSYLFYSGLGLMVIGALREKFDFNMKIHFRMIFFGTILFSGSIFVLALSEKMNVDLTSFFGPVTPIGGLCMIIGWFTLVVKYFRQVRSAK